MIITTRLLTVKFKNELFVFYVLNKGKKSEFFNAILKFHTNKNYKIVIIYRYVRVL